MISEENLGSNKESISTALLACGICAVDIEFNGAGGCADIIKIEYLAKESPSGVTKPEYQKLEDATVSYIQESQADCDGDASDESEADVPVIIPLADAVEKTAWVLMDNTEDLDFHDWGAEGEILIDAEKQEIRVEFTRSFSVTY